MSGFMDVISLPIKDSESINAVPFSYGVIQCIGVFNSYLFACQTPGTLQL